jgi:hypothetical protein
MIDYLIILEPNTLYVFFHAPLIAFNISSFRDNAWESN